MDTSALNIQSDPQLKSGGDGRVRPCWKYTGCKGEKSNEKLAATRRECMYVVQHKSVIPLWKAKPLIKHKHVRTLGNIFRAF